MSLETIHIANNVPDGAVRLGAIQVSGIDLQHAEAPPSMEDELATCIAERRQGLSLQQDAMRIACRRMLRHGRYRASGRGKPASEYLLRAAATEFPRINAPVDAVNLVSLKHLVPISLCDVELADSNRYEVRLGREEEAYVFNSAGQTLALRDLVCGCRITDEGSDPIVTPIKDSLATKVKPGSNHLLAIIYFPAAASEVAASFEPITEELGRWLGQCGPHATFRWCIVEPDEATQT